MESLGKDVHVVILPFLSLEVGVRPLVESLHVGFFLGIGMVRFDHGCREMVEKKSWSWG